MYVGERKGGGGKCLGEREVSPQAEESSTATIVITCPINGLLWGHPTQTHTCPNTTPPPRDFWVRPRKGATLLWVHGRY